MRYHEIINERRSNSEHPAQQKVDAYDILKKYSDRDDIYISYTQIDKLGINPQSDHNTPNGIYCYPLKEIFPKMKHSKDVPYAGDGKFIWIMQAAEDDVMDLSEYTKREWERDALKLKQFILKTELANMSATDFDELVHSIKTDKSIQKHPGEYLWHLTYYLVEELNKSPNYWNYLLRVVLGYKAISDKMGLGLIHPNEPIQAVFLSVGAFKVLDKIRNTDMFDTHNIDLPNSDTIAWVRQLPTVQRKKALKVNPRLLDPSIDSIQTINSLPIHKEYTAQYLINNITKDNIDQIPKDVLKFCATYSVESLLRRLIRRNKSNLITADLLDGVDKFDLFASLSNMYNSKRMIPDNVLIDLVNMHDDAMILMGALLKDYVKKIMQK